jgi:hypothetical protein
MTSPIPPLRPNYTRADFSAGQTVVLRCDGSTGVARILHGRRATVLKASNTRRLLVRLRPDGADRAIGDLRVTPNQVELIFE